MKRLVTFGFVETRIYVTEFIHLLRQFLKFHIEAQRLASI